MSNLINRNDIIILQGTTWKLLFPIFELDGSPAVLTNYTARCQIRSSVAGEVLYAFPTGSTGAGIEDNNVTLSVAPATSSAWTWGSGVYDIEIVHSNGDVFRVSQGQVKVSPEVTR